MADIEYGGFDGVERSGQGLGASQLVSWAGALLSMLLLAGLIVWGYRLTMRDVSAVPVVRALTGPVRERPANPGGVTAPHQGLAVNEVQAEGTVANPPDRVILAPPPIRLDAGAGGARQLGVPARVPEVAPAARPAVVGAAPAARPAVVARTASARQTGQSVAIAEALAVAQTAGKAALASAALSAASPRPAATTSVAADLSGVLRSPRPQPRPAVILAEARLGTLAGGAMPESIDADPASITPGTRLVQLGAYPDRNTARSSWVRLSARLSDYMAGHKRLIVKAESGGKSFYRLRMTGFSSLAETRRFCVALRGAGAECIPVTAR